MLRGQREQVRGGGVWVTRAHRCVDGESWLLCPFPGCTAKGGLIFLGIYPGAHNICQGSNGKCG